MHTVLKDYVRIHGLDMPTVRLVYLDYLCTC
jgi:hypothetical protein